MKTIYDEAIENLRSVMAKFIIPNVEETDYGCCYDSCHFYNALDDEETKWLHSVYKTLKRAKKEHELLELYHKWLFERHFPFDELRDTINKIGILEKELEELK